MQQHPHHPGTPWAITVISALALVACSPADKPSATGPAPEAAKTVTMAASTVDTAFEAALKSSFHPKGQAGLERLERNTMQRACSEQEAPSAKVAQAIMKAAQASVKYPADGQYLGDWKAGKALASIGTGMQYTDDPEVANGGNCYACHQLEPEEIAYGTIGPSLTGYGKLRGQSEEMLKFAWTRLYNPHAYNACSHMPRFGDAGILTEQQLKDAMAFLFDPESPVNQ